MRAITPRVVASPDRFSRRWRASLLASFGLALTMGGCARAKNACDQVPTPPVKPAQTVQTAAAHYVIGADDVLAIRFWGQNDMSAEVSVRPDGRVTLPLLNDIQAAGLTPEQLRDILVEAAQKFVEDPNATVTVKQINSRKVFITGQVEKPGPYSLTGSTTVLQLIAMAGGLKEFADGKNISLMRADGVRQVIFEFNYQEVLKRKNLQQNIELRPGDTIVVP
jgi:polysaccharide biosynthesis/export protein